MSTQPHPNPPPAQRPHAVPLLVRGSLDVGLLVCLFLFCAIMVGAGWHDHVLRPWDRYYPYYYWSVGGGVALASLAAMLWNLARRRWVEPTATGFIVTQRNRSVTYTDADVVGLTRTFWGKIGGFVRHRVVVELQRGGESTVLYCNYTCQPDKPDPLASLWLRVTLDLARRVRAGLDQGARLKGKGWRLDRDGLRHEGGVVPLDRVTKVAYFDNRLHVWQDDDVTACVRLRAWTPNVHPLGSLLWEMAGGADGNRPLPTPLGRALVYRRSLDWLLGIGVMIVGTAISGGIAAITYTDPHAHPASGMCSGLLFVLFTILSVFFLYRGATSRVYFHEGGVVQPGRHGTTALLHQEIGTVTYLPGPTLIFKPIEGVDKPDVGYYSGILLEDRELLARRDHICTILARRLVGGVPDGPVKWTAEMRFLPGGLEYTPWSLFGNAASVTIPYRLTRYKIENGIFHLYATGHEKVVYKEVTFSPNFFVGLMLLNLLYETCGDEPVRQPGLPANPDPD